MQIIFQIDMDRPKEKALFEALLKAYSDYNKPEEEPQVQIADLKYEIKLEKPDLKYEIKLEKPDLKPEIRGDAPAPIKRKPGRPKVESDLPPMEESDHISVADLNARKVVHGEPNDELDMFGDGTDSKVITVEDLIEGFRVYAGKHSLEKAKKILDKFGARNVRLIPVDKFKEAWEMVKV